MKIGLIDLIKIVSVSVLWILCSSVGFKDETFVPTKNSFYFY